MSMREQRTKELEDLLRTFMTKGAQLQQAEAEAALQQLMTQGWHQCKTGEEFLVMKGRIEMLQTTVMYQQLVKNEYENLDDMQFEDEAPKEDDPQNPLED